MTAQPKIPYETEYAHWHPNGEAKQWTRKLAEAGKLSSPAARIPYWGPPHYRRVNAGERLR